ncbi:hypothetical protein AB0K60_13305 [Thermopolyspora sp. NPDC052614]|uniref:hypothetical protein n=1 Tax=Thermopolyspora sp. NPDC052614 TaxID=3155682 RepID=UPI00341F9A6C
MATVQRRLPGIVFEPWSPPPDDVLPRMDIAGFVGFAETGPIGTPVAVPDPARFTEVFGGPVTLFRDVASGERVTGYLAAAVETFFRNGGRRCWVVRVAGAGEPAPASPPGPEPVRERLAAFEAALFLDPDLADVGTATLLATADHLRDQSERPRPLTGAHALLGIDEVTLVAVPDAAQTPWRRAHPKPPPPPAPPPSAPEPEPDDCAHDRGPGFHDLAPAPRPSPAIPPGAPASGVADASQAVPDEGWTRDPGATADALLAVQAAVVRMCAARGDMLAVLAAPYGAGADEAAAHAARLRAALGDERTLGFGALYHPWTMTGGGDTVPPDGAAAGVLANTAATRGCWTAPANSPLAGVVALRPALDPRTYLRLQDGRVNTVRREPRGFLWLSAATLSADPDLGRLGTRRLLSLLRRIAHRHSTWSFAFEPNDQVLCRAVRRRFEEILARLLAGGAFAGATPDEAYQVTVGGGPARLGENRLTVELRVAPSAPLRFLTVRLVNAGDATLVAEVG